MLTACNAQRPGGATGLASFFCAKRFASSSVSHKRGYYLCVFSFMGLFGRKKNNSTVAAAGKTGTIEQPSSSRTYPPAPNFGPLQHSVGASADSDKAPQHFGYDIPPSQYLPSSRSYMTESRNTSPVSSGRRYRSESPPAALSSRSCHNHLAWQKGQQQFPVGSSGSPQSGSVSCDTCCVCCDSGDINRSCCCASHNSRSLNPSSAACAGHCCPSCCNHSHHCHAESKCYSSPLRTSTNENTEVYHTTYACFDPNCKGGSSCSHLYATENAEASNVGRRSAVNLNESTSSVTPGVVKTVTTTTYHQPSSGRLFLGNGGITQQQVQLNGPHAGQVILPNVPGVTTHPYLVTTNTRPVPATLAGVPVVVPATPAAVAGPPIYLGAVQTRGAQGAPQYRRLEY